MTVEQDSTSQRCTYSCPKFIPTHVLVTVAKLATKPKVVSKKFTCNSTFSLRSGPFCLPFSQLWDAEERRELTSGGRGV